MTPFITYLDVKTQYPIEIIDLRYQSDQITPKRSQPFMEDDVDPK